MVRWCINQQIDSHLNTLILRRIPFQSLLHTPIYLFLSYLSMCRMYCLLSTPFLPLINFTLLFLGIAEVCAPHELFYWTNDLEGCSFESSSTEILRVEEMVDEKEDDDPDLTWTSAISTKG